MDTLLLLLRLEQIDGVAVDDGRGRVVGDKRVHRHRPHRPTVA